MTKPPTSVRSIRLTEDSWAWLSAEAERRAVNVNALVARMVSDARLPTYPERAAARVEAGGFKPMSTPLLTSMIRDAAVSHRAATNIQVGPAPVAPGSRLKGAKK